jgi:C1A family cysteine protease
MSEFKKYKLLESLSPEDERDYHIAMMAIPKPKVFPETFSLTYSGEIKDQGQVGSCVGHSLAYCREIQEEAQTKVYKKFSVGFIYGNRGPRDSKDEGMIPRQALKQLQKCGDVLYDQFPLNAEYPVVSAEIAKNLGLLLKDAYPYRITTYTRCKTVNDIKTALMTLGPVTCGIPVYESFYNIGADGIAPIPNAQTEQLYGYHEVTIIGWTKDHLILLNSWSDKWGDKGKFYLPFNFPIDEAWSITDKVFTAA